MKRLYSVLVVSLLAALSYGQQNYELMLNTGMGNFTPRANMQETVYFFSEGVDGYTYWLLQFHEIPIAEERASFEQSGALLLEYVPNNAYVTAIPSNFDWKTLDGSVRARIPFNATIYSMAFELKAHKALQEAPYPKWAVKGNQIALNVKYFRNVKDAVAKFKADGYEVLHSNAAAHQVRVQVPIEDMKTLANLQYVQYMEAVPPPPTKDDTEGRSMHRSNAINTDYGAGRHYDGTGVTVALADDGTIGPHIDYEGRLTQHATANNGNHGDMTAGILFGAGNLNPIMRGMATGAYMHYYAINNYPQVVDAVQNYNNLDVVITSTSYSQGQGGEYTTDTEFIDGQVHQNPQLIHVFSAGNAGTQNHGYGAGAGWGNITGGYKAGKNVIACGNLNDRDELENSSSRGPAMDGRIKPDICANGAGQLSTDGPNDYQVGGGTSAAAPGIAGITAQLYQAYRDLNGGNNPETPLLKACLLNSAEDLGNPGPDYQFGWGRVNALRAVTILEDNRYLSAAVGQGGSNSHTITVPANTAQLRVMVYWLDVEGSSMAAKALVNDLNMEVVDPGLVTFNPWVLDPTPVPANLDANAVRGVDDLNNMEQVTIDAPAAGTYTVNVEGFAIPQGPQTYYLVYEFVEDDILVTYPLGGEGMVPGETELVRWDAFGNTGDFTLEYSLDNGASWTVETTTINGDLRFYEWMVPTALTGEALIRVSRGGANGQSAVPFSIIEVPQNIVVDWACPDSIGLVWDAVPNAIGYEISMLGAMYMDSIGTSTTNSHTIYGLSPLNEHWFSVKALGPTNAIGRRANAINKIPGTWNCALPIDAENTLMYPTSGTYRTCQNLGTMNVSITLKNNSLTPISNVPVYYQLNNNPVVMETYGPTLNPGASATYTFTTPADLSNTGSYALNTWIGLVGDGNAYNDTLVADIIVIGGIMATLPWTEDFEVFPLCATDADCEAITCGVPNSWVNEINLQHDDIDWRTNEGDTPSNQTGPSQDYNPGTATGNYLYLEASGSCNDKEAYLLTPCIDLTTAITPQLEFRYHMSGIEMGELHIDALTDAGWDLDITSPLIGDQGNSWQLATANLSPYAGSIVVLRFRGITGQGYRSDVSIDDVSVRETTAPPTADFEADPTFTCVDKTVVFTDFSINSPTQWEWDFTPATYTYVGGTNANSQHPQVQFNAIGAYDVTLIATNQYGSDTLTQTTFIKIDAGSTLPFEEDFENSFPPVGWLIEDPGGPFTWQEGQNIWGSDGFQTTVAWVENYTYDNVGAEDGLITRPIDLTTASSAVMTFDVAYARYSQQYSEGLRIDISTDCGDTYVPTGYFKEGTDLATVANDVTSSWEPVFPFDDWRNDTVDLSAFVGNLVRIKFVNINGYGNNLYIDNINLNDTVQTSVGELGNNDRFHVYPNPTGGQVTLQFVTQQEKTVQYTVANPLGEVLIQKTLSKTSGARYEQVDLSGYADGVYLIYGRVGKAPFYQRVVKH